MDTTSAATNSGGSQIIMYVLLGIIIVTVIVVLFVKGRKNNDGQLSEVDFNKTGTVTEIFVVIAMCIMIWGTFVSLSMLGASLGGYRGVDILTSNYLLPALEASGNNNGGVTFFIYLLKGCILASFALLIIAAVFLIKRFFNKQIKVGADCAISIMCSRSSVGKNQVNVSAKEQPIYGSNVEESVASVPAEKKPINSEWRKTRSVKLNRVGGIIAAVALCLLAIFYLWEGTYFADIISIFLACATIAIFTVIYCRRKSFSIYMLKAALPATLLWLYPFITLVRAFIAFIVEFENFIEYDGISYMILEIIQALIIFIILAVMWILTGVALTKKERASKGLIKAALITAGIAVFWCFCGAYVILIIYDQYFYWGIFLNALFAVPFIVYVILQCVDVNSAEYPFSNTSMGAKKESNELIIDAEPYVYGLSEDDKFTCETDENENINNKQ